MWIRCEVRKTETLFTMKIKCVSDGLCFPTNLFMSLGYVHMKKAHKHNLAYLNQYIIL